MADHQNFILSSLDKDERKFLLAGARPFPLVFGEAVLQPGQTVSDVFFPESGVISIITEAANGEAAEGGVTGSEGAAALPEALGSGQMRSSGVVQAAGMAWRVEAARCRQLYETSKAFRLAAAKAAEFQVVEARQSLLCRSYHPIDQRLARWLLEMAERSKDHAAMLPMTQEILGVMLAVQRTTVTAAATRLREAGLISYLRGKIAIRDVAGLEKAACACHDAMRQAEAQILGRERVRPPQI